MGLLKEIRSRARYVIGPTLGVCGAAYFGYHIVHGDRGLLAWWQLRQSVGLARQQVAQVQGVRERIQLRVRLLGPKGLDRDMLEERARVMLNYGHPDDVVIFEPSETAPQKRSK